MDAVTPLEVVLSPVDYPDEGEEAQYDAFLYSGPKDEHHVACVPGDAPGGRDAWVALFQQAPNMARMLLTDMEDGHRRDCPHSLRRFRTVAVPCSTECANQRAVLQLAKVLSW